MTTTNIYVLKCEKGKYYVGKSADVERRFKEHVEGKGSSWTKQYKPIKIEKIHKNVSSFDEDKITKELMAKYGIDNVRGGTYISEEIDDSDRYSLLREIWGATDCCTTCGRKGHFSSKCYARTTVDGDTLEDEDVEEEDKRRPICYRCGTFGHYATTCWK